MSASVFREQLCMNKCHLSAPDDTRSLCVKRCLKTLMLLQIYTGYYLYVERGVHCVERGVYCVERGVHSVEWGVHSVEWGVHFGVHVLCHFSELHTINCITRYLRLTVLTRINCISCY